MKDLNGENPPSGTARALPEVPEMTFVRFVLWTAVGTTLSGLPLYYLVIWLCGSSAISLSAWIAYSAWLGIGVGLFNMPAYFREFSNRLATPAIAFFHPGFLWIVGLVLMLTAVASCLLLK
jgi:hypothetical protein